MDVQDRPEPWRAAAEAKVPYLDPTRPEVRFQGEAFVVLGSFQFADRHAQ